MFDRSHFNDILARYKQGFAASWWENEKYKWEAVKCFQDNWDENADDFADMLTRSIAGAKNLLASAKFFPAAEIKELAAAAPNEVRSMFIALFDESRDVCERIDTFKNQSSDLSEKYRDNKSHYQNGNAISVYLWLRYPDRYYTFRFSEVKAVSDELKSSYKFKKAAYTDNIRNTYKLYDEICEELKRDTELVGLVSSLLTDTCYPDPGLKTLTADFCYYINMNSSKEAAAETDEKWHYTNYDPGLSEDDWLELLNDKEVFHDSSLEIMKRMKDCGGQASCKQLSLKYGRTANFYNAGSVRLAQRVAKKTGCAVLDRDDKKDRWWTILYLGRKTNKDEEGSYILKLRSELAAALDKVDLTNVRLYADPAIPDDDELYEAVPHSFLWLNVNPRICSFSDMAAGEIRSYPLSGSRHRTIPDIKPGDMIIGYESYPTEQITAICTVCPGDEDGNIRFQKTEGLTYPIGYAQLWQCPELKDMDYFRDPHRRLLSLTEEEYDFIIDLIREENPLQPVSEAAAYTKEDFLKEVYMTQAQYEALADTLRDKKNIILQGAPGVGKTFAAKRLAYSIMGETDEDRIEFVQFHQNYSYEDFMMGYKPAADGFELKYGIFYRFCRKAANRPYKDFFFIIDEINRGSMSQIFGELLMLIERDYRGKKASLAYNGLGFSVPENLYIIGMMNTADRSLAMIDYALRRRFSFFEIEPGFDSEGFIRYQKGLKDAVLDRLIERVKELNREIASDRSLGKGFCIGHSYFCGRQVCTEQWLHSVVDRDIIPMLSEYWFDDTARLQRWEKILQGVFQ